MSATSPIKPSASAPTPDAYDAIPVARPVGLAYEPPGEARDPTSDSFLLTALRLGVFHALNALLSNVGFVLVLVGTVASMLLLPLCCFGVVTFRFLLYLVGFLAELDVSLYNYISPPSDYIYVSVPRQSRFFEFSGVRLSPNLSTFSPGALLVALYFATIKFAVGLLSSISLSVAFSLPLSALSDDSTQDTFFTSFLGVVGFVVLASLLLLVGAALMKFAAGVSRASTRYFCCEKLSTYQYVQRANAYPTAVPTYGTSVAAPHTDGSERVIV